MAKLSVNVNKVASLRNTRPQSNVPSVRRAAQICLDAGAHGITIHPRPDQRHIRPSDVFEIAELLKGYPQAEFNIEGNPFEGAYMEHCRVARPTQATLVPDSRDQPTSDHGWDLAKDAERLKPILETLKSFGCRVSLFMDAAPEGMDLAAKLGVDRVELYTEPYAAQFAAGNADAAKPYAAAAQRALELGLGVNAGHDLNLQNLPPFVKEVPNVLEVSIGHALIADALEFGLPETVTRYLRACGGAS